MLVGFLIDYKLCTAEGHKSIQGRTKYSIFMSFWIHRRHLIPYGLMDSFTNCTILVSEEKHEGCWYSNMSCCVFLDGLVSEVFPVNQGIRQDGVLSPWLYMCFNNDIAKSLDEIGCEIMVESIGQISNVTVANDLALISPRVKGLQRMINKMKEYSNMWRFIFNPLKTFIVTFGERRKLSRRIKKCVHGICIISL